MLCSRCIHPGDPKKAAGPVPRESRRNRTETIGHFGARGLLGHFSHVIQNDLLMKLEGAGSCCPRFDGSGQVGGSCPNCMSEKGAETYVATHVHLGWGLTAYGERQVLTDRVMWLCAALTPISVAPSPHFHK